MITICHLDRSRSERIVWLMEELGLPYGLEVFERRPDILAPEDLKRVHPLGRAPAIRDGDVVLAEAGAIVETSSRATAVTGWPGRPRSPTSRATSNPNCG
jgi:glutathione S-transferase